MTWKPAGHAAERNAHSLQALVPIRHMSGCPHVPISARIYSRSNPPNCADAAWIRPTYIPRPAAYSHSWWHLAAWGREQSGTP